ncbi:hypothetical protein V6N11_035718 [Hibiscus sabdariffa]|uniref:Uncharacterized protein n=1 Tax=Hibiscus sabdariffa TaxID=183260 RepID=A0ABR2R8U0_9ROSI
MAANPSSATDTPAETDEPVQASEDQYIPHTTTGESSAESSHAQSGKSEEIRPPPPFPQRLKKKKQDYQFKKFLDILKQVHINLPLVEALQQMPNYAKFLKDMVTRKKHIEEFETAAAAETCLALMHNKVPAKKTDPGSFTIECFIGHNYPTKALSDPGASINLMPKSVFQKLGIGEAKPTTVMLQLADHSCVQPEGKLEDILVQIDKFIFPGDFLILDCEADEHARIILGRPFLSTSRAIIDFDKDEIIFKIEEDDVKMKSITKKLDKGKSIAESPAKDTPKINLYMGAHVERDRAAILPNYGLEQFVYNRLNELGWFRLARQPARANYNWVLEFYANNAVGEDFSIVRGRRVLATVATINALLGLSDDEPSFYAMLGCQPPQPLARGEVVEYIRQAQSHANIPQPNCGPNEAAADPHDPDWATYMRKMDVADATPINMAMPTPPASPTTTAAPPTAEAGPSAPAAPVEPQRTPPPSPPVVPSEEAAPPLHILQLRSHLQRIEARQLQFQEEIKVFNKNLLKFLCFQFPVAATIFGQPSSSPPQPSVSAAAVAQPSTHTSAKAGATEELHFSSDDENDVFDWQSPRDHLQPLGPTTTPAPVVPILSPAPTPTASAIAERPTPDSPARRKGKVTAGRTIGRDIPSSPEDEAEQRPGKRRRKYHVITTESDEDDSTIEVPVARPEQSADPSLSNTF